MFLHDSFVAFVVSFAEGVFQDVLVIVYTMEASGERIKA